jgi:putative acetyltransferase
MQMRSETKADYARVHALNCAAFNQRTEANLVDMLRARGEAVISLVAEDNSDIVGHILFSRLMTPQRCLALAPVAVLPERQNEGIGTALIRRGLSMAKQSRWLAVFVLGDPEYYTRFGFSVDAADPFEAPYPKEHMMALALAPGALNALEKTLAYAAPFSTVE